MTAVTQMRNAYARHRRPFFAAALGLLLAGCNTTMENLSADLKPSDNPVTVDSVGRADRFAEIARQQHPRILATYGGEYSDPKLERMVAKVVGGLTLDPDNPNQTYRITILNSPAINAFALPGGYVYVTRGLLALATDASEVAAVLSHEMAHVTANHGIERQRQEERAVIETRVVAEVLSSTIDSKTAAARQKLRLAAFSRNQELQADVIGVRMLGEAGYDPYAAARFLDSMAAYARFTAVDPDSDQSLDFLSSHPNAPQRVELARLHARAFGAEGSIGDRGRDYYLAGIDGLLYGDAPEEGYVRGQTFLHGKLGIRFDVPAGFQIDNKAEAVLATGPGDVAIRFDGVADSRGQSLVNYISSGWVTGLKPETIRPVSLNGLEAATARAAADRWEFDVTVVRIDNQIYRFLTAVPAGSKALEPTAAILSASFRKLTPPEIASLKPLRVRVVTARAGDTVASLAGRMMGTDRKLDLFRLINAMTAASTVRPGEKFKIISE